MNRQAKFKTRKAWNIPGHVHFLTFSTVDRIPYFADETFCEVLAESVRRAKAKHNFAVLAYVFMPDHVHLVIYPLNDIYDISKILKSIKLSVTKTAQRRAMVKENMWEPGGGYDRNVYSDEERTEKIGYTHLNPVRKGLVEDGTKYRWSSAKWWHTGVQGDIQCHTKSEFEN